MSDKTTSSIGPRSFETISEEDGESPWEKLLGDVKSAVPTITKTNASSATISRSGDEVALPAGIDLEANKLTRSKSLNQRRNSSGLLSTIPRQLRLSLRGVRSEPSSVKDVPTHTRNDSALNLLLRFQDVIECKKTGGLHLQRKKEAWVAITKQFNSIRKLGGGSYNPILTDADHQVLTILDDQIRPDENPFDEAAEYFEDSIQELTLEPPVHEYSPKNTMPKGKSLNNQRCNMKTKKNPKNNVVLCNQKSAEMLKKNY